MCLSEGRAFWAEGTPEGRNVPVEEHGGGQCGWLEWSEVNKVMTGIQIMWNHEGYH